MALNMQLTLFLFLVASYAGVMGREFLDSSIIKTGGKYLSSSYIDHWIMDHAVPPPDNCTAGPGVLLPDPEDCKNYYVCQDAETVYPVAQTCPDTFDCFDPADSKCIVEDGTKCADACAGGAGGACAILECPADITAPTVVPKLSDCTKYILCFPNGATKGQVEIPCSESGKPYFNGAECVADAAECCNCQDPVCEGTKFEVFPDPHDGHSFYSCLDPDLDAAFELVGPSTCPDKGCFTVDGGCDSATTECDAPCVAGGDSTADGGSTSASTPSSGSSTPSSDSSTPSSDSSTPSSDSSTPSSDSSTPSSDSTSSDTSPDSSDTTTSGSTTTDDGCTTLSDFNCPAKGFYAHCDTCDPSYFKCDTAASSPTLGYCTGDLVFNPTPDYPYCVRPENCPFPQ